MSDADRSQAELQAITAGYQLGRPVGAPEAPSVTLRVIPLAPPLTSAQEERVRQIVREELDRLRPVFLPAAPAFRSEP
jgi:hypothetical protein